ncbi:MAG: amidase [Fuerstiella sp.]|nr:amidase [Fuerstiella sp.]MCP4504870.1 amidase [Fuerstiella sp.]
MDNDFDNALSAPPADASVMPTRRQLLAALSAAGIGTVAFRRAVAQTVRQSGGIDEESIRNAEWVAGIELSEEERKTAAASVQGVLRKCEQMRAVAVGYDTVPAIRFDPEMFDAEVCIRANQCPKCLSPSDPVVPDKPGLSEHLSFRSIRELGTALRSGDVSAVQLTRYCLDGLTQCDPVLKCVVTLTEDLAMRQAEQADRELAAGQDRGPLHGIPWGAKDLIAVADYPTTWGAPQFTKRVIEQTATVAQKLEHAGAVLVAKLSLGALAMGDRWFGGQTRNPWNPEQGSSGSSAGSASAVAAGLVPFALGSETLGSIVSPSRRCGIAALRPTFGRVSRQGCMALSWTMDKIGPLARNIDDCGLVFDAIHGADSGDPTSVERWFQWPMQVDLRQLKIGRVEGVPLATADQKILGILEEQGANIIPVSLPDEFPEWAVSLMLDAEAATIFHDLVATKNTDGLNRWPEIFRKMHFMTAVDYLHASRLRSRLMQKMSDVFRLVDLYIGGGDLGICNLTGHPTVVIPAVMAGDGETRQPACGTLTGRLHDEATLLAAARLVESHTGVPGQNVPGINAVKSHESPGN